MTLSDVAKEIKFFESIGSPEGGRETGNSGDNARQNAQIILVLYVSRCLSIFYNEEFDPGSG